MPDESPEKLSSDQARIAELEGLLARRTTELRKINAQFLKEQAERRQLAEEIRQNAVFYQEIIELSPDPIVVQVGGRFAFANPAGLGMLGVERLEDLVGREVLDFIYPDDREKVAERMRLLNEERVSAPRIEERFQSLDGSVITVEAVAAPIVYQDRPGALVILHDITEREAMERALLESEQRNRARAAEMEALMDAVPAIIWISHDAECREMSGNRYGYEFLRVDPSANLSKTAPPDELAVQPYRNMKDGREIPPHELPMQVAAATGRPARGYEFDIVFSDGASRRLMGNVTGLFDAEGKPSGAVGAFMDITDRVRVVERLRESEERYRGLFESMSEGFALHEIICDDHGKPVDYRFLDVNPAFEALTGLTRAELIGRIKSEIPQLQGDDPRWIEIYGKVALTGEPVRFENYSPVLKQYYEVFAYCPAPGQFAVIFTNITERKEMEEALRESEAQATINLTKYMVLFEAFPQGITITDAEGKVVETNAEAERLLGVNRATHVQRQIDGAEWWLIRPDGTPMPPEEYASVRALTEHRRVENVEMGVVRAGEPVTWINVTATPLPLAGYGVVIAYSDITARKEAEREAEEGKSILEALMDSVPEGITIAEAGDRLTMISRYGQEVLGRYRVGETIQELIGRWRVFHADGETPMTAAETPLGRALRGETVRNAEIYQINAAGDKLDLLCNAAPIHDANGAITGGVVAWREISERKRMEEALREMEVQRRLLEYRERERQELARDLHDGPIQTLTSTLFNVQFAKEAIGDPSVGVEFEQIGLSLKNAVRELRSLVNELRPPSLIRFGLSKAIRVHLEDLGERHPEINLTAELADDVEGLSQQAALTLFRVYQEGMNNIVRHAQASDAWVRLEVGEGQVDLEVGDNGRGFSVAHDLGELTALGHFGLAGMFERAEAIGGKLEITSLPGEGTRIRVRVPLKRRAGGG